MTDTPERDEWIGKHEYVMSGRIERTEARWWIPCRVCGAADDSPIMHFQYGMERAAATPAGTPEGYCESCGKHVGTGAGTAAIHEAMNGHPYRLPAAPAGTLEAVAYLCEGCGAVGVEPNSGGGHTIPGSVPDNCGPVVPLLRAEDVLDADGLAMLDASIAAPAGTPSDASRLADLEKAAWNAAEAMETTGYLHRFGYDHPHSVALRGLADALGATRTPLGLRATPAPAPTEDK